MHKELIDMMVGDVSMLKDIQIILRIRDDPNNHQPGMTMSVFYSRCDIKATESNPNPCPSYPISLGT